MAMKVKYDEAVELLTALNYKTASRKDPIRLASALESLKDVDDIEVKKKKLADKGLKNLLDAIMTATEEEKDIKVIGKPSKNGKPKAKAQDDDDEEEEEEEEDEEEEDEEEEEEEESEEDEDEEEEEEEEEEEPKAKKKGGKAKKGKKGKKDDDDEEEEEPKSKKKKKVKKAKREPVEKDAFGNRVGTRTSRINLAIINAKKPISMKQIEEKVEATSLHSHVYKLMQADWVKKVDGKYALTKKGAKKAGK